MSVYAFSIDNYRRSGEEVETLMALAQDKLAHLLQARALGLSCMHFKGAALRSGLAAACAGFAVNGGSRAGAGARCNG